MTEAREAKDAGHEAGLIDEYSALRKSIDVDRNLLCVLKKACDMNNPGRDIPAEDLASIQALEVKIQADEQRLKEINEKFAKTT